ncbi:hypothetical protein CHGG_08674 [Chaetomium globosum CBS 148.51]|uniref:C2H2-type domain-containing protein n=1 Tax=Chaetomium globosum (strain ATCC 6205 / CBS 148.51 / DSM 1962 / NBRC 6347 / NRRL 1970) TaxID=306901 RepID=Q2GTN0_CHAGB|nr:uncharacterized protein CHGG_08674 [Chaetomium globosum CBS 148.51]EAQ84660.1 hypothetical protein CHGG_08674 [Chaetomium globosum CBS 148.51]
MASLSFIMDVNDDHPPGARSPLNKRARAAKNLTSAAPLQETTPNPEARPKHVTDPGPATTQQDINQAAPVGSTKRRGTSSRGLGSAAASAQVEIGPGTQDITTTSSSTPSSPPLSGFTTRKSKRQRSTTSSDSMDRSRYSSAASPSSMPRGPQRPMPLHPVTTQYTPKITPKTGRVSKAKKGLPVHVCDICRPPKTFTRAEHLRRHQLGHGEPRFQCPGCDRAFHRADLLVRHQEKHKHDGDDLSKAGSPQHSPRPSSAGLSFQPQRSSPTPSRPIASPAATETPRTPGVNGGNQPGFSHASQDFRGGYPFPPTISIVNPAQPSSLSGAYHDDLDGYQPRAGPPPSICVVTHGPQFQSDMPELPDASPLPSSASDSTTYSTPVSDVSRNPRPWARHRSPYPSAAPRGLASSGPGLEANPSFADPSFMNPYSDHRQATDSTFDGTLTVPSSLEYTTAGAGHHPPPLSATSNGTIRAHQHQHSSSISSLRGQTPPMDASSHGPSGPIYASASHLPRHLDPAVDLDRRKGLIHHDLLDSHVAMDLGLSVGYAAASPGTDNASHSSDLVPELDLAFIGGCALPGPPSITIPLPGPVRAAIPRYIEVYWAQVDPILPFIHYQSEDRTRGNQLHEFAWQEVKRIPQWSLQTMQAILLCEYFARFRGRKAVTRPSKPFESLYSRVSASRSFSIPPSSALAEDNGLWLVDTTAWSPASSPTSSSSSLCDAATPTSSTMSPFALRHLSPLQSVPWGSFPSSRVRSSATSPFGTTFASSDSSLAFVFPRSMGSNLNLNLPSASSPSSSPYSRSRTQPSWSSLFDPDRQSPVATTAPSLPLAAPLLQAPGQAYSHRVLNQQVLSQNTALLDHALLAAEQQRLPSLHDRWRSWVDTESRRRLLATCVFVDGHAAIYQQQRRSQDAEVGGAMQPIPLLGRTTKPWEATSVEEWANTVAADPGSLEPEHVLPLEHLTREDVTNRTPTDRVIILSVLAQRLPRRQRPPPTFLHLRQQLPRAGARPPFPPLHQPHQKRLRLWVTVNPPFCTPSGAAGAGGVLAGLSVLRATVYAARAVLAFLGRQSAGDGGGGGEGDEEGSGGGSGSGSGSPWSEDMSDYWAMYVCALICWAFTYPARGGAADGQGQGQGQGQSGAGGGGGSGRGRSASGAPGGPAGGGSGANSPALTPNGAAAVASDEEAVGWLRLVAAEGVRLEDVVRVRGRREAFGVVGLVRKKLESDCVGGRSRLYVDAVGVLRKLEEGMGLKPF